jgi:hypothetical protein
MKCEDADQILQRATSIQWTGRRKAMDEGADVLFKAINEGCSDPEIIFEAFKYVIGGSHNTDPETLSQITKLADIAIANAPNDIKVLEEAMKVYYFVESEFPKRRIDKHELYQRILELDEENIYCLRLRAIERFTKAVNITVDEAIQLLEKAKRIDPTNVDVIGSLASAYVEAGNI